MTISAACKRSNEPDRPPQQSRRWQRTTRNGALLLILSLVLAGCIQPDAPLPGSTGRPPTLLPTAASVVAQPTAVPVVGPTAIPAAGGISAYPPEADRLWQQAQVGPEQVAVLFLHDAANNPCIRYIFRAKVASRCAVPGQTLIGVAGVEAAADGKSYTIIAGRALDTRIVAASVELTPSGNQPAQISSEGFILVLEGSHAPLDAIPVDQFGNLVGAKFKF